MGADGPGSLPEGSDGPGQHEQDDRARQAAAGRDRGATADEGQEQRPAFAPASLAGPQERPEAVRARAPKASARTTAPDARSGICDGSRTVMAYRP